MAKDKYRLAPGVRSARSEDGAIVLDIEHGQMFNLNRVGSKILDMAGSGSTEQEIVEAICREFNVHQDSVVRDVQELIASLMKHSLIEPCV